MEHIADLWPLAVSELLLSPPFSLHRQRMSFGIVILEMAPHLIFNGDMKIVQGHIFEVGLQIVMMAPAVPLCILAF